MDRGDPFASASSELSTVEEVTSASSSPGIARASDYTESMVSLPTIADRSEPYGGLAPAEPTTHPLPRPPVQPPPPGRPASEARASGPLNPPPPPNLSVPALSFHNDTIELAGHAALSLASQLAPRVFLHPDTDDYPISIDDYLLACSSPEGIDPWSRERLEPDSDLLASQQRQRILPVVVHTFSRLITAPHIPHLHAWTLTYFVLLYANQPDATVCGCLPLRGSVLEPLVGRSGHVADVEFVVVLAEPWSRATGEEDPDDLLGINRVIPRFVFYSAHGSTESQWVASGDPGPIPVFVARDTHANYPDGGAKVRIWGFHIDWCAPTDAAQGQQRPQQRLPASPLGPVLHPGAYSLQYVATHHPWRGFSGAMGPDGIGGLGGAGRMDLPSSDTHSAATAWRRRLFRWS